MKTINCLSKILGILVLMLIFSPAFAEGPVATSSLPGGVFFTDSDDGTGETWGRVGGENLAFSNFDLALFDTLTWGAVDITSIGIALDGTINNNTTEILSFSSLNGNQAIWTGESQVLLFSGTSTVLTPVDTRFVLTVTSGGGALNLVVDPISGLPYVNVIAANGQFVANLRMEAKLQSGGDWEPMLDFFDRLPTTGDGLAISSFNHGFFYDLAGGGGSGGGLSLEEHDTNMVNKTNQLADDLDFLTIESVNRLTDLSTQANALGEQLRDVSNNQSESANRLSDLSSHADTLEELVRGLSNNELAELLSRTGIIDQMVRDLSDQLGSGGSVPTSGEISQIVGSSKDELVQVLLFLWGLTPGGEGYPDPATIPQISDLSTQESVDALRTFLNDYLTGQSLQLAELKLQIDNMKQQLNELQPLPVLTLDVESSNRDSKHGQRLLILSRDNGVPVDASSFTINTVVETKSEGFTMVPVDFTRRIIAEGLSEIDLNLPKSLRSAKILHITAEHDHGNGDIHSGAIIVGNLREEHD